MFARVNRRLLEAVLPTAIGVLVFLFLEHLAWMYSGHTNWSEKVIEVPKGVSLSWISRELASEGVIDDSVRFELTARLTGSSADLKAGTYLFGAKTSPQAVLSKLTRGNTYSYKLTIPEGLRIEQVAELAREVPWIDETTFLELAYDTAFARKLGVRVPNLEGYLYPNTYFVDANSSSEALIQRLVSECLQVVGRLEQDAQIPAEYSVHEVLTLASIIEAEVTVPEERPRVSAVFLNRLRIGWKLQADPTIRFALNKYGVKLSLEDLEVESAYNTYLHHGLPPGPICSPGEASIRAVFEPLEGCQDLFFVATGNGDHVSSRTEAEHLRARASLRRHGGS